MKHHYLFLVIVLIASLSVRSQSLIKGRVLSFDEKLPLPGAVIRVTGNSKALSTDANGMFALQVSNKQVKIEISFVGYKKQVVETVSAIKDTLYIFLHPDVSELQEVVIFDGYRKTSGERFTGSFVQIDNEMFNRQVSTDVLSRLEAIAGGVSVDRGTNGTSGRIMIRGLSTIQGPKEVLVILDNFPYDGDINNINPNDVESISVLKDAAASSIWGARAANGVIVINTKKGTFNQPLAISVTGNITTGKKPSLNYIPQMSSADFIEVEKVLFNNGYYEDKINAVNHPVLSPVVELLIRRSSANTADQQAIDNQIELFKNTDIRNEFDQHIYQPSFRQQYAINLTAGSQAAHWTASSGIDRNTDNLDANLSRANLRFQSVLRPFKVLDLTAGLLYTESRTKNGKPGYGEINSAGGAFLPYLRLADDRQAPLSIPKDWRKAFLDTIGGGRLLDWNYYPLEDYKHSGISGLTKDVLINLGASFEPLKGLKADLKYVHEMQNYSGRTLYDSQSYFARNLVNAYTAINGDGSVTYNIPLGGIFDQSDTKMSSDNIRGQLNYSAIWHDHRIEALGGAEVRRAHSVSSSHRLYGYNDDVLTYRDVDYNSQYPSIISGAMSYIPDNDGLSDRRTNFVSYFGNAAYTYKKRYTISSSARKDASNLFGLNTNDQWNPFWSAGISWLLSEEKFYTNKVIPYLKIRATYGFSGNINPAMVAASTIYYYPSVSKYTGTPYARFDNYYNPDLKWETSKMLNAGIDFSSRAGKIKGSIEYYRKRGVNLFGNEQIDYTTGITSVVKNAAAMSGQGMDIAVSSLNIDRGIKWRSEINISYYKDKVTDYYLGSRQGSNFVSYSNSSTTITGLKGKPVYSIFGYRWAGLDHATGNPLGYVDGSTSSDYAAILGSGTSVEDLKYFGSAIPTTFGSFTNSLSYGNLSLDVSLLFKLGYYFRRESINYTNLFTNWKGHSDFSKRWQRPGDESFTNVPAFVYPLNSNRELFYAASEALIEKGDHVRLQYVNLMWTAPVKKRNHPFRSAQIYFNASNLGVLWRANGEGIDPDYNYGYSLVPPASFTLGLRMNMK